MKTHWNFLRGMSIAVLLVAGLSAIALEDLKEKLAQTPEFAAPTSVQHKKVEEGLEVYRFKYDNLFNYDFPDNLIREADSITTSQGYYGYIEFVTPASNLKTN